MAEESTKKAEVADVSAEPAAAAGETPKDVEVSPTPPAAEEKKPDDSKALVLVEKVADPAPAEKSTGGSADRDVILAKLETEKRMSLIKAWEESEKTKAENKAIKKMSAVSAWENSKKASIEAELKKMEEALERKKAEYAEKMKNKVAMLHKEAEEKRAMAEARRGEEVLKADEMAAKYRATGLAPTKLFGCLGA